MSFSVSLKRFGLSFSKNGLKSSDDEDDEEEEQSEVLMDGE